MECGRLLVVENDFNVATSRAWNDIAPLLRLSRENALHIFHRDTGVVVLFVDDECQAVVADREDLRQLPFGLQVGNLTV